MTMNMMQILILILISENLRVADENDCVQNVLIYHENKENHAPRAQVYIF